MSYLGTRKDAIADIKAVTAADPTNGPDSGGSPINKGGTSGGGLGGKEEFAPKTYQLHDPVKSLRRQYK